MPFKILWSFHQILPTTLATLNMVTFTKLGIKIPSFSKLLRSVLGYVKEMYIFMDLKHKVLQQANLLICVFLKHLCLTACFFSDLILLWFKQTKDNKHVFFNEMDVLYFILIIYSLILCIFVDFMMLCNITIYNTIHAYFCVHIESATKVTTFCTILMFIQNWIIKSGCFWVQLNLKSIEYFNQTRAISIKTRNWLIAMLNEELDLWVIIHPKHLFYPL